MNKNNLLENDKKTLSYALENFREYIDLNKIKHLVVEGDREKYNGTFEKALMLKEDGTERDINMLIKYLLVSVDFSKDNMWHNSYALCNLKTLEEDVLRAMYNNDAIKSKHEIYLMINPNIPQDILKEYIDKKINEQEIPNIDNLVKNIKDYDQINEYAKHPFLANGIFDNINANNESYNIVLDAMIKDQNNRSDDGYNYRFGKQLKELMEKRQLSSELLDRIIDSPFAYMNLSSIALQKNISDYAAQKIVDWSDKVSGGTNAKHARADLLKNENISTKFTDQIIENNNYYNPNKDNVVSDYLNSIANFFNK